jgi:hypothetical protein
LLNRMGTCCSRKRRSWKTPNKRIGHLKLSNLTPTVPSKSPTASQLSSSCAKSSATPKFRLPKNPNTSTMCSPTFCGVASLGTWKCNCAESKRFA